MKTKLRLMFFAVEVNLLLWLAVGGIAVAGADGPWWHGPVTVDATTILIGFAFAAVVQHWAFYSMRRALKMADAG